MMNKRLLIHDTLDAIARKNIPDDTRMMDTLPTGLRHPRRYSSKAVIVTIAAVFLLATAAFAAYEFFFDPGLQGVKSAGMGSNMNVTAPAAALSTETVDNMTATLQWAYADANRLGLEIHFDGYQGVGYIGDTTVTDDEGNNVVNSVTGSISDEDPSTFMFSIHFAN